MGDRVMVVPRSRLPPTADEPDDGNVDKPAELTPKHPAGNGHVKRCSRPRRPAPIVCAFLRGMTRLCAGRGRSLAVTGHRSPADGA